MRLTWLKVLILLLAAACAGLFWWENAVLLAHTLPVTLRLPFVEIRPLPPDGPRIDLMLVVAFAGGFLLAYILGVFRRMRSALEIRRLKKQMRTSPEPAGRTRTDTGATPTGGDSAPAPATNGPQDTKAIGTSGS